MNPHLQKISDFIENDNHLSVDEKATLQKTIQDAVSAFAITEFKLERTEKVKRTTAILLEETIAELEQKREAVEAQNRELAVETALERIRTKVTAMKESPDLLDIVVAMRAEFVGLGHEAHYFWHMRWLPDVYEKAMTSGDGTRIGNVMKLPRHMHGDIKLIADWEESDAATVIYTMDADSAIAYVDKMIALGDFEQIDPNAPGADDIRHIGGLTFVMARTTHGEIGYSLPGEVPSPPVQDLATLVRFAAVFDLAYRRFEDLKRSEKQIYEGKIELALERVRARTMAMQNSEELAETSSVLFRQIKDLGFETWSCGFCIWQENDIAELWMGADSGELLPPMLIPYKEDITHRDVYDAFNRGENVYEKIWEGAELDAHYSFLKSIPSVNDAIKVLEESGLALPAKQCYYAGFFKHGYLLIITKEPNAELTELTKRFAQVFDLTYTRFLDLKTAEANALRAEQDLVEIVAARKKAEAALSELRATQTQLIQSEKMASLGELTAGIAHEIQNPLNFVNNFSEVSIELLDEIEVESRKSNVERDDDLISEIHQDIKQNLEKISHHGKRADAIVKGMLQHSRATSGQKEATDINALADEYLRLAYHGLRAKDKSFNADLLTDFEAKLPKIEIVPQDIGRVLLNLITNAFHATQERRKSEGESYKPLVDVATSINENSIEIKVKDNGNGIPDNIKDKIFQPFFTTKPTGEGTGLGLSLAYDIVKAHGGELKVHSKEFEGTIFIIVLPL